MVAFSRLERVECARPLLPAWNADAAREASRFLPDSTHHTRNTSSRRAACRTRRCVSRRRAARPSAAVNSSERRRANDKLSSGATTMRIFEKTLAPSVTKAVIGWRRRGVRRRLRARARMAWRAPRAAHARWPAPRGGGDGLSVRWRRAARGETHRPPRPHPAPRRHREHTRPSPRTRRAAAYGFARRRRGSGSRRRGDRRRWRPGCGSANRRRPSSEPSQTHACRRRRRKGNYLAGASSVQPSSRCRGALRAEPTPPSSQESG